MVAAVVNSQAPTCSCRSELQRAAQCKVVVGSCRSVVAIMRCRKRGCCSERQVAWLPEWTEKVSAFGICNLGSRTLMQPGSKTQDAGSKIHRPWIWLQNKHTEMIWTGRHRGSINTYMKYTQLIQILEWKYKEMRSTVQMMTGFTLLITYWDNTWKHPAPQAQTCWETKQPNLTERVWDQPSRLLCQKRSE